MVGGSLWLLEPSKPSTTYPRKLGFAFRMGIPLLLQLSPSTAHEFRSRAVLNFNEQTKFPPSMKRNKLESTKAGKLLCKFNSSYPSGHCACQSLLKEALYSQGEAWIITLKCVQFGFNFISDVYISFEPSFLARINYIYVSMLVDHFHQSLFFLAVYESRLILYYAKNWQGRCFLDHWSTTKPKQGQLVQMFLS